jgi:hypothetical protein
MLTRASSSLPELLTMVGENRMEPRSTRRTLRHSLIVDVEVVDLKSWIRIRERTKDLSLYGCGVSTATPFPAGTKVMLKMVYGREKITAFCMVILGRPDIGMGIVFTTVEPKDQKLLEDWITELAVPQ